MLKRGVFLVTLFVVLVALIGVSSVAADSFDREVQPTPHPPICASVIEPPALFVLRCTDIGGDITDIFMLSTHPDNFQTVIDIDGDTAELLVYLPDDGAKFVFYWFVCDGQGNITSGRYPELPVFRR